MPIRVYNTLTQAKEPFQPVHPPKVGMYVCGPTVYSPSHVGHMVGPVIFDTIKRYLTYRGFDVTWVVNITDVDDKLIVQAQKEGTTVKDLAERVTADYLECLAALGVDGIDHMPRATEYIAEIIAITQGLIDKGFAYPSGGDVYFDVARAAEYGKLSHRDPEDLMAGARIEPTEKKRHPGDFALWKGSKPGEPAWESPWGPGRPGWHIECSAMSMKLLGEHFDIHGGGLDLVFPHHENEIVQSESFTGKAFATYWLHNGLLTKDGKKISKSDPGTVVVMRDLLQQYDPDTLRCLFLASHYRRPTDYGPGRLDEIRRSLQAFRIFFVLFQELTGHDFFSLEISEKASTIPPEFQTTKVAEHYQRFLDAMDDDFNTGAALGELFDLLRELNRTADQLERDRSMGPIREYLEFGAKALREISAVLGLFRRPYKPKLEQSEVDLQEDSATRRLAELSQDFSRFREKSAEQQAKLIDALGELSHRLGEIETNARRAGQFLAILVNLREEQRRAKNFALGDRIRDDLAKFGVILEDRPGGKTSVRIDRIP